MHFSVSGNGIGLIGGLVLFGVLMIAFTVVVTIVTRVVRGPDERTGEADMRAPEDDYIL